jgi:hypothetical protein
MAHEHGAGVPKACLRDHYDEFGTSWNPSFGAGWWANSSVRLRGSVARAFRVPTFTERYYSDPANLAREDVGPEKAWAEEAGADIVMRGGWLLQTSVFARQDEDVIDWLRATTAERWQTARGATSAHWGNALRLGGKRSMSSIRKRSMTAISLTRDVNRPGRAYARLRAATTPQVWRSRAHGFRGKPT